jgi:steroid 5-alpha reductase family enzyme
VQSGKKCFVTGLRFSDAANAVRSHGCSRGLQPQPLKHPNLFGEVVQWWGIWLLAFGAPGAWFGVLRPLTITVLILKVSGIPMLEKEMAENPDFAEHKRRTSIFVPRIPKT